MTYQQNEAFSKQKEGTKHSQATIWVSQPVGCWGRLDAREEEETGSQQLSPLEKGL